MIHGNHTARALCLNGTSPVDLNGETWGASTQDTQRQCLTLPEEGTARGRVTEEKAEIKKSDQPELKHQRLHFSSTGHAQVCCILTLVLLGSLTFTDRVLLLYIF